MPVDKGGMVHSYDWKPNKPDGDDGGFGSFVLIFFLCAGFLLGGFVWGAILGYGHAPTKYVDVPGPTVYVDVPGPAVPGPERVVKVPGPVRYETRTIVRTKSYKWCPADELNAAEFSRLRDDP